VSLVANARMYSATPRTKQAWRTLMSWVLRDAGLDWEVIDYDAPQPLNALWARDDLGLAMMCGLPFARRVPQPQLVAAPVPSPARYGGRAQYCTDVVVRADAPWRSLPETFGAVAGYTLSDSLSGGVAFDRFLAAWRTPQQPALYRRAVGGLIHARGVIEALVRGDIDVGPLDSYYHDLLRHDAPVFAAQVRTVAMTPMRPIPPLVATAPLAPGQLQALRQSLQAAARASALAPVRECLLLAGFAEPEPAQYDVLREMAELTPDVLEKL